jgi:NADPH-dependent curcumin reductase
MTETIQRIVLASRPVGEPTLDNFRSDKVPIPQPGPGQMLLRTQWLSLDPYMRGRMSDAPSYAKPVGIGDVMEGGTVSEVVASNVPQFAKGDVVVGRVPAGRPMLCPMVLACKRSIRREHRFRLHSAFSECPE